ncbi:MAG: HAD family hydrolase [Spirochaetaceae bacterium]|nr:MAG: HAD family hydrolase [Spirochaetaceae bacterium]
MQQRYIFFDMGGTIDTHTYDRDCGVQATQRIRELLVSVGIEIPMNDDDLYDLVTRGQTEYREWREQTYIELPPERVWAQFILKSQDLRPDQLGAIAEQLAYIVDTQYYRRILRPEVPRVLEKLKARGFGLGIISNIQSKRQVPDDLERYGIKELFDPVVLSCEHGRRKPDPTIFHYAARLAGVPTSSCVHVGDRISRDILGAKRAGFALAVQIRHDFTESDEPNEPKPDAVIDNMKELPSLLKERTTARIGNHTTTCRSDAIRAFLFDAADTLYYRPDPGRRFRDFLLHLGLEDHLPDPGDLRTLQEEAQYGKISIEEYRIAVLSLHGVQNPEDLAQGLEVLGEENRDIRFFSGVTETLRHLKNTGYLLGIVTNTAVPLHEKLLWFESADIGSVWDCLISSKEVGFRKPEKEIYEAALEQLGVEPGQAVFVGHEAAELEGAKKTGLYTVAFNYEEGVDADVYIHKIDELLHCTSALRP